MNKKIYLLIFSLLLILVIGYLLKVDTEGSTVYQNLKKEIPKEGTIIHFINIEHGEATYIQLENGENILIDTGNHSSQAEILAYLQKHEITRIHHLIITNEQDEHMGNFSELINKIRVDKVYSTNHVYDFIKALMDKNMELDNQPEMVVLIAGDVLAFDQETRIKVLHPTENLSVSPQDNSLVFQFEHGKTLFLFTSNITSSVEEKLIQKYNLHSQILKVSDFGSNQSSSTSFLDEVDAHVAIIFHRPEYYLDPGVLERLEESWMDVYPLQKHGHVLIHCTHDDYSVYVLPKEKDFADL